MATQAIVKRPVLEAIVEVKDRIASRLPSGIDPDRFMLGINTAIQKNKDLLNCQPQSIILAAYDAAELGISLSPALSLGYLVPFGGVCQFMVGYRGLIQKAHASGLVKTLFAEVVYANDTFLRQYAPVRNLVHNPADGDRGEKVGAYAFVEYVNGTRDWEYMTAEQIERRRKHSRNPNSLMWSTFWEEGWRKTPIRVLWKRVPITNPGIEKLAEFIEREAQFDELPPDPPTGKLELEPGSPLAPETPTGIPRAVIPNTPIQVDDPPVDRPPAAAAAAKPAVVVSIAVGKQETLFRGDVRKVLKDLPKVGAKMPNKSSGTWHMPAGRTHELIALLQAAGLGFEEVDPVSGKPIAEQYEGAAVASAPFAEDQPAGYNPDAEEPELPF